MDPETYNAFIVSVGLRITTAMFLGFPIEPEIEDMNREMFRSAMEAGQPCWPVIRLLGFEPDGSAKVDLDMEGDVEGAIHTAHRVQARHTN